MSEESSTLWSARPAKRQHPSTSSSHPKWVCVCCDNESHAQLYIKYVAYCDDEEGDVSSNSTVHLGFTCEHQLMFWCWPAERYGVASVHFPLDMKQQSMFISRPKRKSPKFWKSRGNLLYSYVHLRRVLNDEYAFKTRSFILTWTHTSLKTCSLNQTIVSHSFVSFKVILYALEFSFLV